MKLEEKQKQIKETLLEVKRAKEEAEVAKQEAMAEVEALRTKLKDEQAAADKSQQDSISEEIQQAIVGIGNTWMTDQRVWSQIIDLRDSSGIRYLRR